MTAFLSFITIISIIFTFAVLGFALFVLITLLQVLFLAKEYFTRENKKARMKGWH